MGDFSQPALSTSRKKEKKMQNSRTTPLITDIENLSIGYYLETSSFERLIIKHGFGSIWQQFYEYTRDNRRGIILGHNHKPGDCKDALILLIERLYETEKELLNKILFHIFKGFIDWNYNDLELNEIFEDLNLIDFPEEWLKDLKDTYLEKNRIILDNKKFDKIEEAIDEHIKINDSEILKAKKSEWIRLIEVSELNEAIKQILEYSKLQTKLSLRNEMINQSSRLHRIQKKFREGIIDIDTENLELNKINKAVIEIIDNIE